jgi:hypothetical protein
LGTERRAEENKPVEADDRPKDSDPVRADEQPLDEVAHPKRRNREVECEEDHQVDKDVEDQMGGQSVPHVRGVQ